jgi:glucosyl-3-phosphoglycerate synthase
LNEARTLHRALSDATAAALGADQVRFVNSASTDGSAGLAAAMGVPVIDAPVGKGRAIAAAVHSTETPFLCLLDADILGASRNIPAGIAAALRMSRADMIVGDFTEEPGTVNAG